MSKLQGLLFGLATLVLVVASTVAFVRWSWLPLPLVSDRIAIDNAIGVSLLVTGALFIVTNLLLAWFAFRYQDHEGATAAYWHDSPRLEWSWTLITAAIMATFAVSALRLWAQVQNSEPPQNALVVEVTGQQFAWNVRYPGKDNVFGRTDAKLADPSALNFIGIDKSDPAAADDQIMPQNTLILVEGRAVRVRLRSLDVIHSFFLPQFRVKQDAMPGLTGEIWFVPTKAGQYEIACAEHCGLGHYRMRGQVTVVPAAEFETAVQKAIE
jgi:cytochrome c oxidase subunit 2